VVVEVEVEQHNAALAQEVEEHIAASVLQAAQVQVTLVR
jgi:hypothetical protein